MNYGPWTVGSLHAPSATVDASGRYLGIFNIKEGRDFRGWNDIMSLPRHYWLAEDNSLRMAPVPELEGQRFDEQQVAVQEIPANSEQLLENVSGKAIEIEAVIEPGDAREVGFSGAALAGRRRADAHLVLHVPQQGRRVSPGWLQIDTSQSSLAGDVHGRPPEQGPLHVGARRGPAFAHLHRPQHHRGLRQRQAVPDPARLPLARGQRGRDALRAGAAQRSYVRSAPGRCAASGRS